MPRDRHHPKIRHLLDGIARAFFTPTAELDAAGSGSVLARAGGIDVDCAVSKALGCTDGNIE